MEEEPFTEAKGKYRKRPTSPRASGRISTASKVTSRRKKGPATGLRRGPKGQGAH